MLFIGEQKMGLLIKALLGALVVVLIGVLAKPKTTRSPG